MIPLNHIGGLGLLFAPMLDLVAQCLKPRSTRRWTVWRVRSTARKTHWYYSTGTVSSPHSHFVLANTCCVASVATGRKERCRCLVLSMLRASRFRTFEESALPNVSMQLIHRARDSPGFHTLSSSIPKARILLISLPVLCKHRSGCDAHARLSTSHWHL